MAWIAKRYKAVLAGAGGVLAALLPTLDPNSTAAKVVAFALAALTAVGVYAVRNRDAEK